MKRLVVGFALLLCVTPCLAQDAMVLTPDGPQPWMRIPGGRYGGDLWIPMAPTQPSYPRSGDTSSAIESLRQELRDLEQNRQYGDSEHYLERSRERFSRDMDRQIRGYSRPGQDGER